MFSPISRIISIHYFSFNPFSITENKKAQLDANSFVENNLTAPVID